MSNLRGHIDKWKRIQASLPGIAQSLGQDYADTAVALRKESSIETGINKDGQPGAKVQYSQKQIPTYYLKGKELNASGRAYTKSHALGNWYGLRQAQGLRSQNVNLTDNKLVLRYG